MRLPTFILPAACLSLLLVALPLSPAQGGLNVAGSRRKLVSKPTYRPLPTTPRAQVQRGVPIASVGTYVPPDVAYESWAAWTVPASGAIPSCAYCKKQLKGFVGCAAKQTYPNGLPPAVNWTAPQTCLDKYPGMQECQFGEVGYAAMQTTDPKTSVRLIYGTAVGGCKDALNYYAIVGQGGPKALTAKACTSLNTKILACILATNNDMNQFDNTYTACSAYVNQKQSALSTACWINPSTYSVWYDGYNNTAWLASYPTTTGLYEYTVFPMSQAFYKQGQTGNKKTIVAGNMGGLMPWM